MKNFLEKFFFRSNNLDYISKNIKKLTKETPAEKIFDLVNSYSLDSEIRYVGGCLRKIINKEKVDDIDLATNLEPSQICDIFKKNGINYYETGIKHGTITVVINKFKFEITSLREDTFTDGRHAEVNFSKDWKKDASRRDFTINSIYSDKDGNLFDPFDGRKDLEKGIVNFIGEPDIRIKEDYLRILRYLRFYLDYSHQSHNLETIRKIRMNMDGISKLSKERLLDELKKIIKLNSLEKLSKDKISLELISTIFPELKNLNSFSRLTQIQKKILKNSDFIFLLSLMVIDQTDNFDYFIYKYNISKKDQKRMNIINDFYKEKIKSTTFNDNNLNKIFYYHGKDAVIDILNFKIIKSKKLDNSIKELCDSYKYKEIPTLPISAKTLMKEYKIPEGKQLGMKLKIIEEQWVNNNFEISDQQIKNIINN